MSRGDRFARGVAWGVGAQLASAVVSFFLIPRIVHGFGEENYGAYLLMISCAGWVTMMHMGAGAGMIRFVAEAEGAGDPAAARRAVLRGAKLQLGFSALASVALWFGAPFLAGRAFAIPEFLRGHETWLIRAAAVGGFLSAVNLWAASAFQGYQRFDRQGMQSLALAVLPPAGVLAALRSGRGLGAAAAWFVAAQALVAVASIWEVGRLGERGHGTPRGGPGRRQFLRYCLGFWPGSFAQFASGQLDRVFIAGLRSLSEFTLYAVPLGLLQRLQMLPASAGAALFPLISELQHEHGRDLERLYLRCTRVLVALLAPAYALLFALMPQFLSLWLGGRFGDESVWPARVMVLTQALGVLAFVPTAIAGGRRGGAWPSAAQWSQAVVCLGLWPLLIPRWGLLGAALGSLAAQFFATGIIVAFVHRRVVRLRVERYAVDALAPALAGSAVLLAVAWPLRTRFGGWLGFWSTCAAAGVPYLLVVWGLLPHEDRDYLLKRLPRPTL